LTSGRLVELKPATIYLDNRGSRIWN